MNRRILTYGTFLFTVLFSKYCPGQTIAFTQNWGYLMKGEERYLSGTEPLTDIGYFSAQVTDTGRLGASVPRPSLPGRLRRVRIHLVISTPANKALMYFCLNRDPKTRSDLLNDIVSHSAPFDGVQIDFEVMRAEERNAYLSFLSELKRKLPTNKVLSVALPARTAVANDAFPYASIAAIVDRVIIMAYDEHWRTGPPGPVASIQWCKRVCQFAQKEIPGGKLVMGIPLYGRLWQRETIAKALKYPETLSLWQKDKPLVNRTAGQIPFFEIKRTVSGVAYFEDMRSLKEKLTLYKGLGIAGIGFWRVGQGPAALWTVLSTE